MSFAEVRPYQNGDDVRSIDWNVTARKRSPYIKVFEEERELTLFLVIDISKSTQYGSAKRSKADLLTEIAATLAFSAMGNNDKIGLILFAGQVEKVIPPKKGKSHVMRIIKTILEHEPQHQGTRVDLALEHLLRIQKRHSIVFVMSDFMGELPERALKIAAKRFDLCTIHAYNQGEATLPKVGLLPVVDAETGAIQWLNSQSKSFQNALKTRHTRHLHEVRDLSKRAGAGCITLADQDDFVPPLLQFLKSKGR